MSTSLAAIALPDDLRLIPQPVAMTGLEISGVEQVVCGGYLGHGPKGAVDRKRVRLVFRHIHT